MLNKYAKMLAPVAFTALALLQGALLDSGVSALEWISIAAGVATAVGVYVAPNVPEWPYVKTAVAVTVAVLNAVTQAILDGAGIAAADWVGVVLVALGALGVVVPRNAGDYLARHGGPNHAV